MPLVDVDGVAREDPTAGSIDVVRRFCDTWANADVHALLRYFADDAVYQNMPDPQSARGHTEIRSAIDGFMVGLDRIEFRVHHIVGDGAVVLTERTDVFHLEGVELPVMGTFELDEDGKIAAWRDYFDVRSFMTLRAEATRRL